MEQVAFVFLLSLAATIAAVDNEEPLLLAATESNHLQVYSFASTSVLNEIGSDEYVYSVAYAAKKGHVYWSTLDGSVFRADLDGSNIVKIFQIQNNYSLAMAYDWVGDNLYIAQYVELELVICTAGGESCTAMEIEGVGTTAGIALDPIEGKMYYGNNFNRSIYKANMDGSNATEIVSNLNDPLQIVIDFEGSRLYWIDSAGFYLVRSDLNGQDVRLVVQLSYRPWGIAIYGDRLYWSTHNYRTVTSCDRRNSSCTDIRVAYTSQSTIFGIAIADFASQPEPRSNPCADQPCSHICTLTSSTSFRCLCPRNMEISEDQRTCKYIYPVFKDPALLLLQGKEPSALRKLRI